MRGKSGFFLTLMGFLAFLSFSMPHQAQAQSAAAVSTMCDDGTFDLAVQNNLAAHQQALLSHVHNINLLYPITASINQCVQNLADLMAKLPTLGNPFNLVGSAFALIVGSMLMSVCSQVMASIQSVDNAISNMAKFCLPLPNFGKLEIGKLNSTSCAGGVNISILGNFSSPTTPSFYGSSQYMR